MSKKRICPGSDISKMTLDVDIYPTSEPRRFLNDEGSREQLSEWLKTRKLTLIVMDATGGLEIPVAGLLAAAGLPVAAVNIAPSAGFCQSDRRTGEN
jgi:transposase